MSLLGDATPAEIDAQLAALHGRYVADRNESARLRSQAARAVEFNPNDQAFATKLLDRADMLEVRANIAAKMMLPYELEYTDRGGWPRAFVVAGGHVHSTTQCSTCNNGEYLTEFGWVTELSGATEDEIIAAAGSRACTVCYPNAPVTDAPGTIFHATEKEAEQERQAKAAKKAAADAKKAANAIGPYRTTDNETIETVYAAKRYLTDGAEWRWNHPSFSEKDRDAVAALLAAKLGTTPEKELEAAEKRAKNRT